MAYDEQLRKEVNEEREKLGKKAIEEKDDVEFHRNFRTP